MEANSHINRSFLHPHRKKIAYYNSSKYWDFDNNTFFGTTARAQFFKTLISTLILIVTVILFTLFIKHNGSTDSVTSDFHSSMVELNEDTLNFFETLGFPKNSKSIVYDKIEQWGFHKEDIADEEVNENYKKDDIKKYKYSPETYKKILFSYHTTKRDSVLQKNELLYQYLTILKEIEINTFYDFLNNFVILQDLNCLPVNLKGVFINDNLFIPNNKNQIILNNSKREKTLVDKAPFLYLTSHGGTVKNAIHNICKFSRDGYFLGSVLLPFEESGVFFNSISLRGLLILGDYIYVVDSYKKNSKIFQFSNSIPELGNRREFVSTLIAQNEKMNPLMIHPYGIKYYKNYFYVSAQNTSSLLRYKVENGKTLPGPLVKQLKKYDSPGLVVKFSSYEEIRGIDFDESDKCYVANKQTGVQVYDENFKLIKIIPVFSPISIFYNNKNNHILVGSSKTHDIKEYDVHNFELIKVIKHSLLKHVAGITVLDDSIFVVSQKKNKVLEFSLSTGLLKNTIVDDLSDIGERVILSET